MYNKLKEIYRLLIMNDDIMFQDTLFEAQQKCADLLNTLAIENNKTDDLVASFPKHFMFEESIIPDE